MKDKSDALGIATLSNVGLIEFLRQAIEEENEKIDDIHSLVITSRHQFGDGGHESGPIFSMIDRVLESAQGRNLIERLIEEAKSRMEVLTAAAGVHGKINGGRA